MQYIYKKGGDMIQFQKLQRILVGVSDFAELVSPEYDYIFIDKSVFLKELFDRAVKTIVVTRPRHILKPLI